MNKYQLIHGDAREVLRALPDGVVRCCITSPPYYGLRDYGIDEQIGIEPTPAEYVEQLVNVFREVSHVMSNDGTLWVNIGDCYANYKNGESVPQTLLRGTQRETAHELKKGMARSKDKAMLKAINIKNKDLIGIPWMFAFAMRDAGWFLRQDIIWSKPNTMPESVKDRCTKAHEYVFLFSKSERYYFNCDAIKEPAKEAFPKKVSDDSAFCLEGEVGQCYRNRRSVWHIPVSTYKSAHMATYPESLVAICMLAGSQAGDTILDPFNGSGTTGAVALKHNRRYIGIDLNDEYLTIARRRLDGIVEEMSMPLFDGGM